MNDSCTKMGFPTPITHKPYQKITQTLCSNSEKISEQLMNDAAKRLIQIKYGIEEKLIAAPSTHKTISKDLSEPVPKIRKKDEIQITFVNDNDVLAIVAKTGLKKKQF